MSVDRISDEAVEAAVLVMAAASDCDLAEVSEENKRRLRDEVRSALSAALPLLEGGKGEAVAWMIRNKGDGELHWNEELCVFADAASADEMAECLNDGDPPIWEALPLYTAPQPAAQQPEQTISATAAAFATLMKLGYVWNGGDFFDGPEQPAGDGGVELSALVRYGRHEPDCDTCHDSALKPRPKCTCGLGAAIAALRANSGDTK